MLYTPQEIENIQRLAASKDIKNVCLAFEICKARGVNNQLITAVYWMYNFFAWHEELKLRFECYDLIESYWKPSHQIKTIAGIFQTPFIDKQQLKIHHLFQLQTKKWQLDYQWLCDTIAQHFEVKKLDKLTLAFLFQNCSFSVVETLIEQSLYKNSLGMLSLDLGGFDLGNIAHFFYKKNKIQSLKLWGNQLEKLPAVWKNFDQLEELNLAENNLTELPPDFVSLKKLKVLHLKSNPWKDVFHLESVLSQLPQLEFLSLYDQKTVSSHLLHLETLINHGKLSHSANEKNTILGLALDDKVALKKIKLSNLFAALLDTNPEIKRLAKAKIIQWNKPVFNGQFPLPASVTILGLVSFATRNNIESYRDKNITFSDEILATTTHIVLGDNPDFSPLLEQKKYIFLSEEDLIKSLF